MSTSTPSRHTSDAAGNDGINYARETKRSIKQQHDKRENFRIPSEVQEDMHVVTTPTTRNTDTNTNTTRPKRSINPFQGFGFSTTRTNARRSLGFRSAAGIKPVDDSRRDAPAVIVENETFPRVRAVDDAASLANITDTGKSGAVCMHRGVDRGGWETANSYMHVPLQ